MPNPPKKPFNESKPAAKSAIPAKASAAPGIAALHKAEDRVKANMEAAAKTAQSAATTATRQTAELAETAKRTGETVVNLGANAARKTAETGAAQIERLQNDTRQFTAKAADGFRQQTQKGSEALGEVSNLAQRQMEAAAQCGNLMAGMTKEISEELFNYTNRYISNQVEISKDIFSCRTISDLFDLQNKVVRSHFDGFFSETAKLSELMFNYANRAAEPLTEAMQEASQRFTKNLAA